MAVADARVKLRAGIDAGTGGGRATESTTWPLGAAADNPDGGGAVDAIGRSRGGPDIGITRIEQGLNLMQSIEPPIRGPRRTGCWESPIVDVAVGLSVPSVVRQFVLCGELAAPAVAVVHEGDEVARMIGLNGEKRPGDPLANARQVAMIAPARRESSTSTRRSRPAAAPAACPAPPLTPAPRRIATR